MENPYQVQIDQIQDSNGQPLSYVEAGDVIRFYHTGARVERLELVEPVKLQPITELTPNPLQGEILAQRFAFFRKLSSGGDSFYLATTIAAVELMICPGIGPSFREHFTEALGIAIETFQPKPEMRSQLERAWNAMMTYYSYYTFDNCSRVIGRWLVDDTLIPGLTYISKILLASSINLDRKLQKRALIAHEEVKSRIETVFQLGTEVDEIDIIYMGDVLNAQVNLVSYSSGFELKKYNEGQRFEINLFEAAGDYYPLMTRTHSLYMRYPPEQISMFNTTIESLSNFSARQVEELSTAKAQIDVLKRHNQDLTEQAEDAYEQLEQTLSVCQIFGDIILKRIPKNRDPNAHQIFSSIKLATDIMRNIGRVNTDLIRGLDEVINSKYCAYCNEYGNTFRLECGDILCEDCLRLIISRATQGLLVLNDYEIDMQLVREAVCPVCHQRFNNREVLESILNPEEYNTLWDEALRRQRTQQVQIIQCRNCGQEKPESNYFEQTHVECQHFCMDCVTDVIRRGGEQCPECSVSYATAVPYVKDLTLQCAGCYKSRSVIKWLTREEYCQAHGRLCIECVTKSYKLGRCLVCQRAISPDEVKDMQQQMFLRCLRCNESYDRRDILNQKSCICLACKECQKENIEQCILCQGELPKAVREHLEKYLKDQEERKQNLDKECGICYCTHSITECRALPCGHYFGEECIKQMLSCYVSSRDTLDKVRCCPREGCSGLLTANMLQELMTPEEFDKYSRFAISNEFSQVDCPKCGFIFEPWNNRRIQCMNNKCKYVFCKVCNEEYHETGNCRETFIQRKINGLEEYENTLPEDERSGISQCPGCREPYVKDQNCEHVECTNQDCRIAFCFQCSCLRSPTLAHGNHFHRPGCRFHCEEPDQKKDPDKVEKDCSECKRLGRLCPRPKALAVPRRIAPDEV